MKKYFLVSSILALVLLVVGSIGLMSTGDGLRGLSFDFNESTFVSNNINSKVKSFTKEIEVKGNEVKFNIDIPNSKLTVFKGNSDKIIINCNYIDDSDKYIIEEKDNEINIYRKDKMKINFGLFNIGSFLGEKVEILVPESVIADYKVNATNGSIEIGEINSKGIELNTTNGNFKVYDVVVEENFRIQTTNGKIDIKNIQAKNVALETTNGLIELTNIKGDEIDSYTTNGAIDAVDCYAKDISIETTNGAASLENTSDTGYVIENLKLETINGKESIKANYKNRR